MLTSLRVPASCENETKTFLSRVKARDKFTVVSRPGTICEEVVNVLKLFGNDLPDNRCRAYSVSNQLSNVTTSTLN